MVKLSIVIPVFNAAGFIEQSLCDLQAFLDRQLGEGRGVPYELVLVNDGSGDGTLRVALALALADPAIRVVNLLRNFGHQAAATAGLDAATGDVVVLIDADLQDPPEVIAEMAARWEEGADVAYG